MLDFPNAATSNTGDAEIPRKAGGRLHIRWLQMCTINTFPRDRDPSGSRTHGECVAPGLDNVARNYLEHGVSALNSLDRLDLDD